MSINKIIYAGLIPMIICTDVSAQWDFSGSYRLRLETLANAVRENTGSGDQALSHRVNLKAQYKHENFYAIGEIADSRMWLDDDGTPLGTDDINTLEPVQAHVGWKVAAFNGMADIKLGRFTVDMGSRRFVARARFRNTHNSFTGAYAKITRESDLIQLIYAAPDNRFPRNRDDLDENRVKLDKPYADNVFYGVHYTRKHQGKLSSEWLYFGLKEDDQPDLRTRNRDIHTLGLKVIQPYSTGKWGYGLAGAYQFGEARASTSASDINDLDVAAYFVHFHFGYSFEDDWKSTLLFEFDYATGDDRSDDNEYNRFDTLYGVRRFDFGATNLYGTFARSNIFTPGIRWKFKPNKKSSAFLSYRPVWLDDADDALTAIRANNLEGERFVGHQIETRFRYKIRQNLGFETGGVYLDKADFFENATNVNEEGNALYLYVQATYSF